jgi:TolB-like protein
MFLENYDLHNKTEPKKKCIFCFIIFFILFITQTNIFAKAPDTLWTKTYGDIGSDIGYDVQQTTDGGYIIVGSKNTENQWQIYLIKTNNNGDTLWTRTFGNHYGFSVKQTTDGGYIISGSKVVAPMNSVIHLIKTDSLGNMLWEKNYGNDSYGHEVCQTSDGGYIVVGMIFIGTGTNRLDVYLVKTSSNGDSVWSKTYGNSSDNISDIGKSVKQTPDGGYILTGSTQSYGSGGDVWLIKTDPIGNIVWQKNYGGSANDWGEKVIMASDRGYFITGCTYSYGNGNEDAWLIKTDSLGNTTWNKTFGGSASDWADDGRETDDNGYIITGVRDYPLGEVWIIKINQLGDSIWTKILGGSGRDWGLGVIQSLDGGYVIVGRYDTYTVDSTDVWLIKLRSEGVWVYPNSFHRTLQQYQTTNASLIIGNSGNSILNWSVNENPPINWLSENLTSGSINPGDSVILTITFNSNGLASGDYYDTLIISSSDTNNPTIKVSARMTVTQQQITDPLSVFVLSTSRINKFYPDSADILKQKLNQLCYHPEVQGIILDVDESQDIINAFLNWDASDNWKRPSKANAVVTSIDNYLESKILTIPTLRYIILVGEDRIIPYERLRDPIWDPLHIIGDEDDYGYGIKDITLPVAAAIDSNQILTDDIYGDNEDVPPYEPMEYVVSRIIEKPGQIIAQIDYFLTNGSALIPDKILVTNSDHMKDDKYEFISRDLAEAIVTEYQNTYPSSAVDDSLIQRSLTTPDYSATDLHEHFLDRENDIVSINNHSGHYSIETPDYGFLSAWDIVLDSSIFLAGKTIYSLGCHLGLNIGENQKSAMDIPEAFAISKVGVLVANTGYGYMWKGAILFSENFYLHFTQTLISGVTTGDALRNTKYNYWSNSFWEPLGITKKVTMVPILYGLPFYKILPVFVIRGLTAEPNLQGDPVFTGDTLIVEIEQFIESTTPDSSRLWFTFSGAELDAEMDAPVLPKIIITVNKPEYQIASLSLINSHFTEIQPDLPAAIANWQTSDTVSSSVFISDKWYPDEIYRVNTLQFRDSLMQKIVICPVQYYQLTNTWRLYDRLEFAVVSIDTAVLAGDTVFVYPSPYVPKRGHSALTFANLPKEGTIEVYTISGKLIWKHAFSNIGKTFSWNVKTEEGKSVASGVHIYLIKNNAEKVLKKGKFAIIR